LRAGLLLAAGILAACTGEGSDIGPTLPPLPAKVFRVLVQDAEARGVSSAGVTLPQVAGALGVTRREGIVDLPGDPRGAQLLLVDGTSAAAADGDDLGSLAIRFDVDPLGQMAFVVHLPDLAGSSGLGLGAGILQGPAVLDDAGWSGARLELDAGTAVDFGGPASAVLRSGALRSDRIPPLRLGGGQASLATRGIAIDPPEAGFVPAAALSLPNDLGLPAGADVDLFRLDPVDGTWSRTGAGTVGADAQMIRVPAGVPGGGLYAAAVPAPDSARLLGRVLRKGTTDPLFGLRVRAGQVTAVTDGAGRFVLDPVPVGDAGGNRAPVRLSLGGGALVRPANEEFAFDVQPGGERDLGDIESTNVYAVTVRLQLIDRGRVAPRRAISLGDTVSGTGSRAWTDADGSWIFSGVEEGVFGFLSERIDDQEPDEIRVTEGLLFVSRGSNRDIRSFYDLQDWAGNGDPLVWAIDPEFRGAVSGAFVFRNRGGGDEAVGLTRADQINRFDIRGLEAIVTSETDLEGVQVRSAFSIQNVDSGRLEVPLPRASRRPLGAFERFGRVRGQYRGAGPDLRVRVTTPVTFDTWLRAVLDRRAFDAGVPVFSEPSRDGGREFELGVPDFGGDLVATSTAAEPGGTRLVDLAFRGGLGVAPAADLPLDLGDPLAAATPFTAVGALRGRDPRIPAAAFVADLGVLLAGGEVIDVARELGANVRAAAEDLVVELPALAGPAAGAQHLAMLHGAVRDQGADLEQWSLVRFGGPSAAAQPLLMVPVVGSPAPGATLPVAGFEVRYTLPADALWGTIVLRSAAGEPLRRWEAVVSPLRDAQRIRQMPSGPAVLAAGSYTLEVTAYRATPASAPGVVDGRYQGVIARYVGLGLSAYGVAAVSRVRLALTLTE
jgi:hypothetical protein